MTSPVYTPDVRRSIGMWSGVALLIGTMIGAGIFRTPASIAAVVGDPRLILGLWIIFGIVSICGALTLAELATMMPKTGGMYVYLRAAYGNAAAFVFGWLYMVAAIPSGMAALAVFSGELMLGLAGIDPLANPWGIPIVAVTAIILFSCANVAGVKSGSAIQNIFAVIKISALLIVIFGAFVMGQGEVARWWTPSPSATDASAGWMAAVKSVLFTYNGWMYISFVAGELNDPERRLTRIILLGTGGAVVIYLTVNFAYLYLIPLSAMPGKVVALEAMKILVGPAGATIMTACILASVYGALNGVIFTKARVAYALSRDGLTFGQLGRAHPTRATPYVSIAIQGAIAVALVLILRDPLKPLRLFDRLIAYFVMVEWLALVFGIGAIFVLRKKMPDAARPYRTPLYPLIPLVFVGGTVFGLSAMLWSTCAQGDYAPLFGIGLALAGFPVYRIWRRRTSELSPAPVAVAEPVSRE